MLKVDLQYKELIELLYKAIMQRTLLKIYYKSGRRSDWRIIRPYYDMAKSEKKFIACGVPTEELQKLSIDERTSGQYLLAQLMTTLKEGQIQILLETFDDLGIPRERVDDTKTQVVCRFF